VTTRYWDCCRQAGSNYGGSMTCDNNNNSIASNSNSACSGGNGFTCWDMVPWEVSCTVSYAYAAMSTSNFNSYHGKCFQLDFYNSGLNGKSLIVQVTNDGGDVANNQFDILIPGGGVGQFNACSNQWGVSNSSLGAQYGGFLTQCGGAATDASCVTSMCQAAFGSKSELMAGCSWFTGWFATANNPPVNYAEVACPSALTSKSGIN
jgi:hypothetical protein